MSEKSRAKQCKLVYAEVSIDASSFPVPQRKNHRFTKAFGVYERRIALTGEEADVLFRHMDEALNEIQALRATARRAASDDTTQTFATEAEDHDPDR